MRSKISFFPIGNNIEGIISVFDDQEIIDTIFVK